jgi:hypothetical protein
MKGTTRSEDAVSEAIGFIIIFSLVLTGIALVTLYGYPLILKQQISSDERTMEQAMITIQNDMKLLTYSNVPYKDTPLRVSGGALTVLNESTASQSFSVQWWNGTMWRDFSGSPFSPGIIQYTSDQGTAVITLENGAVVKRQQDATGSVMVAEPRWFADKDTSGWYTFVIFLTGIDADGVLGLNGIGSIQMSRTTLPVVEDYSSLAGWNNSIRVKYNADPANDFGKAWENYFTGSSIVTGGLEASGTDGSYLLKNVKRVVIKQYDICIDRL